MNPPPRPPLPPAGEGRGEGELDDRSLSHLVGYAASRAALDMAAPNMAVTLDRMAERGWIERVRSTDDRRSQRIHLTAAGERLAAEAKTIAETMEEPALAGLSRAERALLVELLRKVAAPAAARPKHRASQEYPRAA